MNVNKQLVFLYFKVFFILILIGVILPYVVNLLVNMIPIDNKIISDNCIYVMHNYSNIGSFFYIFIKLLSKIIDF